MSGSFTESVVEEAAPERFASLGATPKESVRDVNRAVTTSIIASTLWVLVVHFTFAFWEF